MVSGTEDSLRMRNGPGTCQRRHSVSVPAGVSTSRLAVRVTRSTCEERGVVQRNLGRPVLNSC
jgi:hypothetical protein